MATKTISVDLEAYERLRRARRSRNESFSMVIKRAVWPPPPHTASRLLEVLAGLPPVTERVLERLDRAQRDDRPPEDPWAEP
jgi:predicted CopG family antitoxin